MTSTALQTPLERPWLDIAGVKIFATREGDQVSGSVEFPYRAYARSSVEIYYRSARPDAASIYNRQSTIENSKARARLDLVNLWMQHCEEFPEVNRLECAKDICRAAPIKCTPRSLQIWAKKFREEGEQGLVENYTPRPRKQLALTGELASQAVQVAAWWAFRIGNIDTIDTPVMHTAAALCGRASLAAILSSIDRYYSWPCDRRKMPFKPFARWARYDFDKWLLRAADLQTKEAGCTVVDPAYLEGNYQHPHGEFTNEPVPLMDPADHRSVPGCLVSSLPPASKTRARDARDRRTRQALERGSKPLRDDPVVSVLAPLDDLYRGMLLRASFKDRDAIAEAVATLPIWWTLVALPAETRERIDRVTFIRPSEKRPGDDAKMARAKVQMFLSELKLLRKGQR